MVLAVSATSVTVTYLATFSKATTLPTTLDKNYWYPVDPATKEGTLDPLPALNTRAQWASLRKKQEITEATVSCPRMPYVSRGLGPLMSIYVGQEVERVRHCGFCVEDSGSDESVMV